jgi:hypothetical protein
MLSDTQFGTLDIAPESCGRNDRSQGWEMTGASPESGLMTLFIHHISKDGLLLQSQTNLRPGECLSIEFPEWGQKKATVVWENRPFYACEFDDPISKPPVSAVLPSVPVGRTVSDSFAMRLGEAENRKDQLRSEVDRLSEESRISFKSELFVIAGLTLLPWAMIGLAVAAIA